MKLTPELLLQAYGCGVFPMAESAEDPDIFWVEPEQRGILPLAQFHLSRRLRRTLRQTPFQFCINQDFSQVVDLCAAPHPDRPSTWINTTIKGLYQQLHEMGNAHSVEVWHEDELIGGLYGVSLGAAFFGESMFTRRRDASKMALCHLVARLRHNQFLLLDTQFLTDHLSQFGGISISRDSYLKELGVAVNRQAEFTAGPPQMSAEQTLELLDAI